MNRTLFVRNRRWFLIGLLALVGVAVFWTFSPGMPVLIGPWAWGSEKQLGEELFNHEWKPNDSLAKGDGVGPVFNDVSCVACHNQGGVGGGGDNSHNVHNYEVLPSERDRELRSGTVHAFSTDPKLKESFTLVRNRFPIIRGSTRTETRDHCSYTITIPDVDPLRQDTVQTTALFGAGWIDKIPSKAITSARRNYMFGSFLKELKAEFDSIPPGRVRILEDGRVGKFGWKAQFATLEEFVAAACANELGLGTPISQQAQPFGSGYPEQEPDLNRKQFNALVAFVNTLPKPIEASPAATEERDRAARGKDLFHSTGCAVCHTPNLGGVKGVYSDFLLHSLTDGQGEGGAPSYGTRRPDVPLPDRHPAESDWKTPPLWGVADSAPYMHDGSAPTLLGAIFAHGGEAKSVRERFNQLGGQDQQAIVAFLNTLKAPPQAKPVQTARK